jgi:DNA-binding MarR family transcriptional regulator
VLPKDRSPAGARVTQILLATFRANGLFLATGDQIAAGEGLTSARWQVLGAVVLAGRPVTVPQIARRMGLSRQSVHATVGRLTSDGLVELVPNADHRRSPVVRLTDLGHARYRALDRLQMAWADRLAHRLPRSELDATIRVLEELCRRLEQQSGDGGHADTAGEER